MRRSSAIPQHLFINGLQPTQRVHTESWKHFVFVFYVMLAYVYCCCLVLKVTELCCELFCFLYLCDLGVMLEFFFSFIVGLRSKRKCFKCHTESTWKTGRDQCWTPVLYQSRQRQYSSGQGTLQVCMISIARDYEILFFRSPLYPQFEFLLLCVDIARALRRWSCRRSIVVSLSLCVEHMFMCFFFCLYDTQLRCKWRASYEYLFVLPEYLGDFTSVIFTNQKSFGWRSIQLQCFFSFRFLCSDFMCFVQDLCDLFLFFCALNVKCFVVFSVFLPSLLVWC